MPFTGQHLIYVRYEFDVSGDLEQQDTGFWADVLAEPGISIEPAYALATAVDKAKEAWASWTTSLFTVDVAGRRVVAYYYGAQIETALFREETALPFSGSGGRMPLQATIAVSTYGYNPTQYVQDAATKRGRMYLPTPSDGVLGTNPYVTVTAQNQLLDDAQDFYGTLREPIKVNIAEDEGYMLPVVVSRAKNYSNPWNYFRVGRVIDTQRRRRNQLTELYVDGPVIP